MQIIRECRMRAAILTGLAKDAPELEFQLLYVAKEYLALATLTEQLNADADRPVSSISERACDVRFWPQSGPFQRCSLMRHDGPS
jgi:hypothetical protein